MCMTWEYIFHDLPGRDMHAPRLRHPAHVVPRQIEEHQVLCPLLFVLHEVRGEEAVFFPAFASGPGAGYGERGYRVPFQLHHDLGRRADEGHIAEMDVKQVGRRIDVPETPVRIEGVAGCIER